MRNRFICPFPRDNKRFYSTSYQNSEVLRHIRKQYAFRNGVTGAFLFIFIGSVYFYSIYAVKQDDLSDVLPSEG
ncbi:hypothetical protein T552_01266 [Pneumocystis carinii B80]|uniref:Cytochrome c oxidase assembly factor 3 n=1 Tax=Pneumocystis carinii (strain B80) TaxID=1408658 RepID=A0A0W4ZLR5_PNEC8|nr:hypothetical protein T552_01266 [Pneumocystis carinii B80]KTW29311.1 hypothetical protein T552_01266 [Pneumocystis carinii B80]